MKNLHTYIHTYIQESLAQNWHELKSVLSGFCRRLGLQAQQQEAELLCNSKNHISSLRLGYEQCRLGFLPQQQEADVVRDGCRLGLPAQRQEVDVMCEDIVEKPPTRFSNVRSLLLTLKNALPLGWGGKTECVKPKKNFLPFTFPFSSFKPKRNSLFPISLSHSLSPAFTAFTLAEVLITLGIIGVVAAMTIPTLISNTQKHDTAVKLEKMYSTISQATKNSELENGLMQSWGTPTLEYGYTTSKSWWNTYFIPYAKLSIIKQCNSTNYSECMNGFNYLDGTSANTSGCSVGGCYLLKDGTSLIFGGVSNDYAGLWVDTNGIKKPNIVGKDIFNIQIRYKSGKVEFAGSEYSRNNLIKQTSAGFCNKKTGLNKGQYCGRVIQLDSWQIKDDYPWN